MAKIKKLSHSNKSENRLSEKSESSVNDMTPYRYNRGQLIHKSHSNGKYCINVDWLELTTLGTIVPVNTIEQPEILTFAKGRVVLKTAGFGGTQHYQYKYNIFLDNELVALVLTSPRNTKVLNAEFSQIKIENNILYQLGWTDKLTTVLGAIGLSVNNYTRLDVAIDGGQVIPFMQAFEHGIYNAIGKSTFVSYKNGRNEPTGYDWGKRSSEKHLTIYNKTLELERSNKQYIKDNWTANGMILENGGQVVPVERCELKLKGKAIKRTVVVDLETGEGELITYKKLEDSRYLAGIFKTHCKRWFEFTANDGDKNKSRDKRRFSPIDWEKIETIAMERLTTTKKPSEVWQAKRTITKLLRDAKRGGYIQDAIHQTLHEYLNKSLAGEQKDLISEAVFDKMVEIFGDLKEQLPTLIVYKIAKEHDILDWAERKETFIEQEMEGIRKVKQEVAPVPVVSSSDLRR